MFPTTRVTLIQSLRDQQNDSAWRTFFGVYGPLVYAMARHGGLKDSQAEEVLSTVMRNFVIALKGGFEVNHEVGLFRSYLRTITNREIAAVRRGRVLGIAGSSADPENVAVDHETPDEHWADVERRERWRLCWERLRESRAVSPRDFQVFEAVVLEERPATKVAAQYGVTVNRLYGIKHSMIRRLRKMREKLDQELGEV